MKKNNCDYFLHTPAKSTTNYVKWAERLQETSKIDYGCIMDHCIIPLHPGDLMAVVARPGHGKSSWMAYMARRTAQRIIASGEQKQCVVYVSWEQSIEEIEAFFQSGKYYSSTDLAWGRVPIDTIREQSIKRINLPIWMIGYSINDADERRPQMTISMVYDAIRSIRYEYNYEPILVCLDYLQIIPTEKSMNRLEQVTEATIQAKHLAMEIGVPIIAGVQARREADSRRLDNPTMADAQWSSAIEQTADKQISLLRPIKIVDSGEIIKVGKHDYTIDEYTLVIKLLKQRFDIGYGIWAVRFEPQTLVLNDYELTSLNTGDVGYINDQNR